MSRTQANRKLLQNLAQGGNGEVEGVIYTLPTLDKYGNACYIMSNGVQWLCDTQEHAAALLNIGNLGV